MSGIDLRDREQHTESTHVRATLVEWRGSCSTSGSHWTASLVMKAPDEPELASQVLRYFVRHPKALDSLEGIARWRLLDEAVEHTVRATNEALDWLVARGVLQQTGGPGRLPVYGLAPGKKEEAARILAELTRRDDDDRGGEKT